MHSSVGRTQLDGVMVFLMVAELRGFRAAAGRLGITPSAVSYAVRALETRVGAPLFSRTTRSVALTEAGERLLAHARPAVEMLTEGIDAASGLGGETRGRLRINAPRAVIPLLVERLVPEFHELHPKVQLELVGEDRLIDIVAEGFDAGIRFGHLVQADMVATSLTPPDRYVVVGSPPFLRKHGRPKNSGGRPQIPVHRVSAGSRGDRAVEVHRRQEASRDWRGRRARDERRRGLHPRGPPWCRALLRGSVAREPVPPQPSSGDGARRSCARAPGALDLLPKPEPVAAEAPSVHRARQGENAAASGNAPSTVDGRAVRPSTSIS